MEIRTFKKEDIAALAELVKEMTDLHHSLDSFYRGAEDYKNLDEMLGGWLDDQEMQVFVAEGNKKVAGYIRVGVETGPEYSAEKKIGIVYDSLVAEKFRRQGIAGRLFTRALEWFGKKKVNFIELNVDSRNGEAIEFWKKLGFETVKLRMRRKI